MNFIFQSKNAFIHFYKDEFHDFIHANIKAFNFLYFKKIFYSIHYPLKQMYPPQPLIQKKHLIILYFLK